MSKKNYTTIAIEDVVLEELKNLSIEYHWFKLTNHSDKIKALILLHKENLK